jgi:protein-S-isoprenylcysteine O-methyltransferase Ste14
MTMAEREPTTISIAMRTVVQAAVFWSVFLFLLPWLITRAEAALGLERFRFEGDVARALGVLVFVAGGSLGIASAACMVRHGRGTPLPLDPARRLVVVGSYRYVRNPMAIAGLAQAVGVGVFLGSAFVIAYAIVGGIVWDLLVRPWEERDLAQRFGSGYEDYRREVRCWIPGRRFSAPRRERAR